MSHTYIERNRCSCSIPQGNHHSQSDNFRILDMMHYNTCTYHHNSFHTNCRSLIMTNDIYNHIPLQQSPHWLQHASQHESFPQQSQFLQSQLLLPLLLLPLPLILKFMLPGVDDMALRAWLITVSAASVIRSMPPDAMLLRAEHEYTTHHYIPVPLLMFDIVARKSPNCGATAASTTMPARPPIASNASCPLRLVFCLFVAGLGCCCSLTCCNSPACASHRHHHFVHLVLVSLSDSTPSLCMHMVHQSS